MKRIITIVLMIALAMLLCACRTSGGADEQTAEREAAENAVVEEAPDVEEDSDGEGVISMKMRINDSEVKVSWENNASVKALAKMAEDGPVTIEMSPYGGFEQVGSIGQTLPSNDTNIKTKAGDIMLYTGDQMVIFHGSNSWAYTRLGKITDKSAAELKELLGGDGVTVTVTAE